MGAEERTPDFQELLDEARRNHVCPQCGVLLERWKWASSRFCGSRCRYRFRDRRRYWEDPEAMREKSRAYYAKHREVRLAAVKAYQRRKSAG